MIILITGPINAGKTTVGKILQERIPRTALLERFRQPIQWMSIEESIPLNIANMVGSAKIFLRHGLNLVIAYPVSLQELRRIEAELSEFGQDIQTFVLAPRLEVATTDRGGRPLQPWEVERIKEQYAEGYHRPGYGQVIDNSEQTPEETAKVILEAVGFTG